MKLKEGVKYKSLAEGFVFTYLGILPDGLMLMEFDNAYINNTHWNPALSSVNIMPWVVDYPEFVKKLKVDKYYHVSSIEPDDYMLYRVKNTKLAKKMYPNLKENGDWLEL